MRKKSVGAPIKYAKKLNDRISVLVNDEFKQEYFSLISEKRGIKASEHITTVLQDDFEQLKNETENK